MPYQPDNRGQGMPVPQHHAMRLANERPGMVGMPRRSPPHGHPSNIALQSYNNFGRHDYHRQPPPPPPPHRHLGGIPPHFSNRPGRSFPAYSPSHPASLRQADEHIQQYPVGRRIPPPHSPRSEAIAGSDAPQHIHGPPPNVRRSAQLPYPQGFYEYGEYGDYARSLPGPHSPTLRSANSKAVGRDGEVLRRFASRPMQPQDRQSLLVAAAVADARRLGPPPHRELLGSPDGSRLQENWGMGMGGGADGYDEYGPIGHNRNQHSPQDENNLQPQHSPMHQGSQFRSPRSPDVGTPYSGGHGSGRVGHSFDQPSTNNNTRRLQIDRTPSKSDNTDDEVSSSIKSNEENNSPKKDEISNNIGCTCKKSKCLKLYCQCFASSQMCNDYCRCLACKNTPKFEVERTEAIRSILVRNPSAFDTKFKAKTEGGSSKVVTAHKLGCKCRKSACLKKYCECYHAEVKCNSNCRCTGCQNQPDSRPPDAFNRQSNYVLMIDAARDLAGLKNSSPNRASSKTIEKTLSNSPSQRTMGSHQDLYPVPSLTASESPSKEDEGRNDDMQQIQYPLSAERTNKSKTNLPLSSDDKASSAVDVLLSAAYALTELGGSGPAKTPYTPGVQSNGSGAVISPSPKRKMSEISFEPTTSGEIFKGDDTMKRNRFEESITPAARNAAAIHRLNMKDTAFRERLRDDIESES